MREILFRGQTRRYGERVRIGDGKKLPSKWVYGGIFPGTGDFSVIYGAEKEDFTGADIEKHPVYSDTVGQYTGLTDKNGKRIFEGDIVKDDSISLLGDVVFSTVGIPSFGINDVHDGLQYHDSFWHELEIIGNIHDNPELLENP